MVNLFQGTRPPVAVLHGIAHAADTGWVGVTANDHARIRFQAERDHDHIIGLLSVELQPGWKTYWRSPGEGRRGPENQLATGR